MRLLLKFILVSAAVTLIDSREIGLRKGITSRSLEHNSDLEILERPVPHPRPRPEPRPERLPERETHPHPPHRPHDYEVTDLNTDDDTSALPRDPQPLKEPGAFCSSDSECQSRLLCNVTCNTGPTGTGQRCSSSEEISSCGLNRTCVEYECSCLYDDDCYWEEKCHQGKCKPHKSNHMSMETIFLAIVGIVFVCFFCLLSMSLFSDSQVNAKTIGRQRIRARARR